MPDAHRDEIAKLESLYSDHPEGRIFTHLAEAYRKAGELDRAREVLDHGIQIHPDYASAHVVRGRVLMDQGQAGEAGAAFEQVLKLDAHNLVALRAMGDLARTEGRRQDAEDYYERLLEVEPADPYVLEALEDLRSSPAADPGTASPKPSGATLSEPEPQPEDSGAAAGLVGLEGLETLDGPGETAGAGEAGSDLAGDLTADVGGAFGEEPAAHEQDASQPPAPSTSPGVMTETIAQVYARQGLYDRAAEVYRELVRERPNEPALRSRLEEMEALAAHSEEGAGGFEPALESEPEAEPEALEGLEPMEMEGYEPGAEPMDGLEVDEVDPETGLAADVTPSDDLPDASGELDVRDVPEPPEEEPWAADFAGGGAAAEDEEDPWSTDLSADDAATVGDQDPWAMDLPADEPAVSESQAEAPVESESESEPAAEAEADSVWAGGDWDAPEAETPYAWGETEPEDDTSTPIQTYFQGLLGWSGGADARASASETDAGSAASAQAPESMPSAESTSAADASGAASGGTAPEQDQEGDDDLEMFQSWLESLKK